MISYSGKNRAAVNWLKAMYFDSPEWTPCNVGTLPAVWIKHREAFEALVLEHPRVFPAYKKGSVDFDFPNGFGAPTYEPGRYTDCWGSVWENIMRGMEAQVVVEPLSEWSAFENWKKHLPDPIKNFEWGPRDLTALAEGIAQAKRRGDMAWARCLMHGHFFMRLYYLRGFENLMVDIATDEPLLRELAEIVTCYNVAAVAKVMEYEPDMIYFGEDLGMQTSLPISPAAWRKLVKPSYIRTFAPVVAKGFPVYLHSDGHILEIIADLIETGVTVLNPQIRANGLEGLQKYAKGKVAINQDLDRQLFPFATPAQIEDHIGEVFEGLYDPKGGLMLLAEVGPEVPLANVHAICRALEKVCKLPEPKNLV